MEDSSFANGEDLEWTRDRPEGIHALRPLTICQMHKADQAWDRAKFTIDGDEINKITAVAHVIQTKVTDNKVEYTLEDGTGRIVARKWESPPSSVLEPDSGFYVRVIGSLSRFRSTTSINVDSIRKVVDVHEPYYHILEAMTTMIYYQRGTAPPPIVAPTASSENIQAQPAAHVTMPAPEQVTFHSIAPAEPNPLQSAAANDATIKPIPNPSILAEPPHTRIPEHMDSEESPVASSSTDPPPLGKRRVLSPDPLSALSNLQRAIILQIMRAGGPASTNGGVDVGTITRGVMYQATPEQIEDALDVLTEKAIIQPIFDEGTYYKLTEQ